MVPMAVNPYLRVLTATRPGRAAAQRTLPARKGRTAAWPAWVPPELVAGLAAVGIERPWRHQAAIAAAAWQGRDAIITTSAGSGKSLGLWLAPLSAIAASAGMDDAGGPGRVRNIAAAPGNTGRRPTALYLAPTKALAADQEQALERIVAASGLGARIRVGVCDGDAEYQVRDWCRDRANVVLTNPDYLHYSVLPGHRRWARLLRGLRYVIVDECHAYRGLFGSHVALVLRRLRRLADHYGASPVFLLGSATTAAPAESAARLIGADPADVTVVGDDAAPRGRRTVVLWKPPVIEGDEPADAAVPPAGAAFDGSEDEDEDGGPADGLAPEVRRGAGPECAELLAELTAAGARTLAFVRSRFAAESVAAQARAMAPPHTAARIASYRGGYLPEERRGLERRLRGGEVAALVTTTALELGIDVAGLDAVLIAGWPGTRVSLWQELGRAGRAGADGLGVWIAGTNPLDSYVVDHPEAVFGAPIEATVFDPANPYVLAPHLCAAAEELPLGAGDTRWFGPEMPGIVAGLEADGVLRHRADGHWYWLPDEPATSLTGLRGADQGVVAILEEATGRLLSEVDAARAETTCHAGAVYVHQGESFVIRSLDLEAGVALAVAGRPRYRTRTNSRETVAVLRERASADGPGARWSFGDVEVRERVVSFSRLRVPGLERIGTWPLDLPEHVLTTTACWLTLEPGTAEAAGLDEADLPGALHALEHTAIGLMPLMATCDRWDLGGLSAADHADTGGPTVFIHDACPGGAGFAERAFGQRGALMAAVRDRLAACPCADGCPSCVQSPKCGNQNQVLSKAAALALARVLAGADPAAPADPADPA